MLSMRAAVSGGNSHGSALSGAPCISLWRCCNALTVNSNANKLSQTADELDKIVVQEAKVFILALPA